MTFTKRGNTHIRVLELSFRNSKELWNAGVLAQLLTSTGSSPRPMVYHWKDKTAERGDFVLFYKKRNIFISRQDFVDGLISGTFILKP